MKEISVDEDKKQKLSNIMYNLYIKIRNWYFNSVFLLQFQLL